MKNYFKCRKCNFYVTKHDKQCSNCGTIKPCPSGIELYYKNSVLSFLNNNTWASYTLVLLYGFGICLGIIWILFSCGFISSVPRIWEVVAIFMISIYSGALAIPMFILNATIKCIFSVIEFMRNFNADKRNSLLNIEKSINDRIGEIDGSISRVKEIKESMSQQISMKDLGKNLSRIDKAREIREMEKKKYIVKLWEIEMIRWQNPLQNLLLFEDLNFEQYTRQLQSLRNAEQKGKDILLTWQKQQDVFNIPEGQRTSVKMQNLLGILDSAINKIIVDQATKQLKLTSPARIFSNSANQISLDVLDLLDARHSLGEFSPDFEKLEFEYEKLIIEMDLTK